MHIYVCVDVCSCSYSGISGVVVEPGLINVRFNMYIYNIYVNICIYVYIYIYIHTYTHICVCMCLCVAVPIPESQILSLKLPFAPK